MSELLEKEGVQHISDSVEFDFDEFEIVELENREEFRPLNSCEGGGCSGCGQPMPCNFGISCC